VIQKFNNDNNNKYQYIYIFSNQQFVTWDTMADYGSYFVTTYKRCKQHRVKEKEKE